MQEIWKDVPGFETTHQASNLGRIRSKDNYDSAGRYKKGRILRYRKNNRGYSQIHMTANGKVHEMLVHRVIAETFIANPMKLPQVNHRDENKDNNAASNLEWCTNIYNRHYGTGIQRMAQHHNYKECVEKGAEKHSIGKVIQCDSNGNAIKIWRSIGEASKSLHCGWQIVKGCCDGKYKQSHGYIWKWA